jgi:hypothetical protein
VHAGDGREKLFQGVGREVIILPTFLFFVVGGSSIGQISPIMKNIVEGK